MADRGHKLTETILADIEDRCKEEYEIAAREMRKKYRDYMAAFEEGRKQQYDLWQAGKISKQEYTNWVYRHTMVGKRWQQMADTLAADLEHTNEMALALARGKMPDVFALNANYGTYEIEHGGKINTGFTLYNHDTAMYLMEDRQLMPGPSSAKAAEIAADKALQWNKRKIQSAVLQGVLQGESPYQIAERLRGVAEMNYHASVRYARTMTTSAQNAGRYESFHRANKLGVDLTLEWQATLDGRTRHSHRLLHGMRTTVDKPFVVDGVKIMYPAQSSGAGASDIPQSLIWNCRCTILAWVKGFEGDTVKSSPKMGKMSFEEWQHAKEPKPKNISFAERIAASSWERGEFDKAFAGNEHTSTLDGGEKSEKIIHTISNLQENYPMQAKGSHDYDCTSRSVVLCEYKDVGIWLPDGDNDRRITEDAAAQVFFVDKGDKRIAVIGFDKGAMFTNYQEAISERAEKIRNGKVLLDIGNGSPEGLAIHEWGHVFAQHMDNAMIHGEKTAEDYWAWYKTLSKDEIKKGISSYAAENRGEFEAECFAEMMMPNPRPLAKKWWEYMQKVVELGY